MSEKMSDKRLEHLKGCRERAKRCNFADKIVCFASLADYQDIVDELIAEVERLRAVSQS